MSMVHYIQKACRTVFGPLGKKCVGMVGGFANLGTIIYVHKYQYFSNINFVNANKRISNTESFLSLLTNCMNYMLRKMSIIVASYDDWSWAFA